MSYQNFKQLVREDLYRYAGDLGLAAFIRVWRYEYGFRLTFFMRLCRYLYEGTLTRFGAYHVAAFLYQLGSVRHGVHISFTSDVGGGLYSPHALNIVVNRRCVIGRNCNLSQGVTLGAANRGDRAGTPIIGNNVFIAPGAVIFGAIQVGDGAAIGSNCVVTKDVPENGVVAGVPGKIISHQGSAGYVNQTLDPPSTDPSENDRTTHHDQSNESNS